MVFSLAELVRGEENFRFFGTCEAEAGFVGGRRSRLGIRWGWSAPSELAHRYVQETEDW